MTCVSIHLLCLPPTIQFPPAHWVSLCVLDSVITLAVNDPDFPLSLLLSDWHLSAVCHAHFLGPFSSFSAPLAHFWLLSSWGSVCPSLFSLLLWVNPVFWPSRGYRNQVLLGQKCPLEHSQRHGPCCTVTSGPPLSLQGCCRFWPACWLVAFPQERSRRIWLSQKEENVHEIFSSFNVHSFFFPFYMHTYFVSL